MEKISIIVPIYNVEKYLIKSLESIVNQTYKNTEIILVDDGSTDSSGKICDDYKKKYKNIIVIHKKNGGLSSARNSGIDISTGKYIFFIDSDDYIELNTIESLYNNIKEYNSDMACCGFRRVDFDTQKIYSKEMIKFNYNYFDVNENTINNCAFISPSAWGKLTKANIIKKARFVEEKTPAEDLIFMLYILPYIKRISFTKTIGYNYMVRSGSLTFKKSKESIDNFKKELFDLRNLYNKKYKNYISLLALVSFIHVGIALPHRVSQTKSDDTKKYIKETKIYLNECIPEWKKIPLKSKEKFDFNCFSIWILKIMYKLNIFILFIKIYNFMINKLKIDKKW